MAQLAGGVESDGPRLGFDRRLELEFHGKMAACGISGGGGGGLKRLFMTQRPSEERITALENANRELAKVKMEAAARGSA